MFMDEGDVFRECFSKIENQDFVCFQEINSLAANYDHCVCTFDKKELMTCDVGLLVGGIDAAATKEVFRKEEMAYLNNPEFVTYKIVWSKD